MELLTSNWPSFPLLAFLAVRFRCRLQPEDPLEECTQAAGAQKSTVPTVHALWITAAAGFPALNTLMKVRLHHEEGMVKQGRQTCD